MTLTLTRKPIPLELASSRLDLFGIVSDRLLPLDMSSIGQLPIKLDGHGALLKDHFDIVDGARDALCLTGDLSNADRVGGGLQMGSMLVESHVGLNLAAGMRQGELTVHGSAGDFACAELRGGKVHITEDVGDYCGAAPHGLRRGMRGGSCVVDGSAGRFLGYRMRRGTLHVRGEVGAGCASSMIAGSIVIGGSVAGPLGVAMHRGSIVLFHDQPPDLPVGFTPLEPVRLSFLPLLLSHVEPDLPKNCPNRFPNGAWQRSLGDRASGGMGEILWFRPNDDEVIQ